MSGRPLPLQAKAAVAKAVLEVQDSKDPTR